MRDEKEILINSLKEYIEWYGVRGKDEKLCNIEQQEYTIKLSFKLLNELGGSYDF